MNSRPIIAGGLAALLAACTLGPDFVPPAAPEGTAYDGAPAAGEVAAGSPAEPAPAMGGKLPDAWWTMFHLPDLDRTLHLAMAGSNSLAAAAATLAQAQEAIVQARAGALPRLDLNAAATRSAVGGGAVGNQYSLGPTAGYDVDLFGATRRQIEQATALADSQRYQLAAATLTLAGDCVTEAVTIAAARAEIATVGDLIANDEKNLDLVQRKFDAGKAAQGDVLTAESQLAGDRTQLPALRQQLSAARHALAVLAGQAPAQWSAPDFDIADFALPAGLPVRLPSQLVRRRPDVLVAEAQAHAAAAAIGVAEAAQYPSLTLSASFTQESLAAWSLFHGASEAWAVGGGLAAPLFHGDALASQTRAAGDVYAAQLASYRQAVLTAFGQVADALRALDHDAELLDETGQALDIAGQSLALQRSSYAAGKASVLDLIVAENAYSQASLGQLRARVQRLDDVVQLIVALGGGWQQGTGAASTVDGQGEQP